ncbi:MAG: hypothetical protein HYS40_07140 [Gemmatimonadetes bacterium]|nr:hypothetical protein [Gemmatimonadota bacterium]
MTFDGERAEAQALDQLEAILRDVAEELAAWRARALKAETELKAAGARSGGTGGGRQEAEAENKVLRQRVEAARVRVHDLLSRLTFLEEQARQSGNGGGAR